MFPQFLGASLGDDLEKPRRAAELQGAAAAGLSLEVAQQCHGASMLSLALILKKHLKRVYQLSDTRCQTFDPSDSAKACEKPVSRALEGVTMDTQHLWSLPASDPLTASSCVAAAKGAGNKVAASKRANTGLEGSTSDTKAEETQCTSPTVLQPVASYLWLRQLFREDYEEMDYNILAGVERDAEKTAKPRGRPRKLSEGHSVKTTAKRGRLQKKGGSSKKDHAESSEEEPSSELE